MSGDASPLRIVLCWHMHQPYYIDPFSDKYILPWTYLHAIKDYVDMAWYLENIEGACAVVNFTPTLIEQIEDYAVDIGRFTALWSKRRVKKNPDLKDPLLNALVTSKTLPAEAAVEVIHACLKANQQRLIDRYEPYARLAEFARWVVKNPEYLEYIRPTFISDLVVWYHIAWFGETVKRHSRLLNKLITKKCDFSYRDRFRLLKLIGKTVRRLMPRYKKLHLQGKVELSVTPYGHPIMPLLLDMNSAREAWPEANLPEQTHYPGGYERSQWHIKHGLAVFKKSFGFTPEGCWPAEGAVCDQSLELLHASGFKWIATGEGVLKNSAAHQQNESLEAEYCVHNKFQFRGGINCFFRDDGLSDEIGFTYSDWHGDDAVANLVHHLKNIKGAQHNLSNSVVSIVLDGENAWEYYPDNGFHFLSALYKELGANPEFELTTFSRSVNEVALALPLEHVVAGSWVYGTFSTWIGGHDKNLAWDLLREAKQVFDHWLNTSNANAARVNKVQHQLAICEESDWFWWFGDDNPAGSVRDFDLLYRKQLSYLYYLMNQTVPDNLQHAISHGGGHAKSGGVMRPGKLSYN